MEPGPQSTLDTLRGIWRDVPGLFSDRVELLSLELHRAGLAFLQIVMLGFALAALGLTAWLLVWILVIAGLVNAGMSLAVALLGALALHMLLGFCLARKLKKLLPMLGLPATRRHLRFADAQAPNPDPSPPTSPGESAQPQGAHHVSAPSSPR